MDTLHRELEDLVAEVHPTFLDFEQLERLVTADELQEFDGECADHDGCRPVLARRVA